jgi:hypothetical protein
MRRLRFAVLALASCTTGRAPVTAPTPAPPPVAVRYGPGQATYRTVEHRHVEQMFQGQPLTTDLATTVDMSISLAARDSGLLATFVIDSVALTGGPVFPAAAAAAARGARFVTTLGPGGAVEQFGGGDPGNPLEQQLAFLLRDFFPVTPAAGVVPGSHWVDTTDTQGTSGGADISVRAINTRSSPGWTTFADARALEILTESAVEIAGSGTQAGQAFTVSGSGRAHGRQYLSAAGLLLGGTRADTTTMRIELSASGAVIPVTQRTTDTTRVVP